MVIIKYITVVSTIKHKNIFPPEIVELSQLSAAEAVVTSGIIKLTQAKAIIQKKMTDIRVKPN